MPVRPRSLPVTTAAQAAARDSAAIAEGTPSFDLMLRAGTATASVILREFSSSLAEGVALFAGPGNNGGDAYVVAAQLARAGVRVRLHAAEPPRTEDAIRAAAIAANALIHGAPTGHEQVVVDALLGTGQSGALRGAIAAGCERISLFRDGGAAIVALDIPTGVNATTGECAAGAVSAAMTLAYGTLKRGHLLARDRVGRIVLADIGLNVHADLDDGAWRLGDATLLQAWLPPSRWNSWKTRRGVVGLVGGARGMAGAIELSTRAALASGAGMVHAIVAEPSIAALQATAGQALVHDREGFDFNSTAFDAIGIGPGLGRDESARKLFERVISASHGKSFVLDADALTLIALRARNEERESAELIADIARTAGGIVCTPHAGEFGRLLNKEGALPQGFDELIALAQSFAIRSRATILLKGTPTVICTSDGAPPTLVARGTPLLATGGSGDLLTGIITTLCAQLVPMPRAAALGAWIHGRAAEVATIGAGTIRGLTLAHVIDSLPHAWRELEHPASFPLYVLAELPAVVS